MLSQKDESRVIFERKNSERRQRHGPKRVKGLSSESHSRKKGIFLMKKDCHVPNIWMFFELINLKNK